MRRAALVAALVAASLPAAGGGAASPAMQAPRERRAPRLTVLSSDADKVTGGDALVEVLVPRGAARHLALSLPDAFTNAAPADCALLLRYLATPAGARLTDAQRQAIGGHRTFGSCQSWAASFANRIDAQAACPDIVPDETIYDPVTNPTGVRCNLTEHVRTQLGVDDDGFAPALYSNDGVQYGLRALQDGTLGVDAFLDLNAGIGGYDRNGKPQAERSLPDPRAIARVVETGLSAAGTGGLAYTPTIDLRTYTDAFPDIHTSYWSVALHERLVGDGVDPRIHVRWIAAPGVNRQADALDAMEAWLSAIEADHRRGPRSRWRCATGRRPRPTVAGPRPRRPRSTTSRPATPDRSRSPPTRASWPAARSPATWCATPPRPSRRITR